MVALGLDVGAKRIGVALSDPTGLLASPLIAIVRSSDRQAVNAVRRLAAEHDVDLVVVGVPLQEGGEDSAQAASIRRFGYKLRAIPGVRVVFSDERFSTATASGLLAVGSARVGAPRSARRREADRRRLDAAAAAVILQDYLDQQRVRG